MEGLIVCCVAGVALVLAHMASAASRRKRKRKWRAAAEERGLSEIELRKDCLVARDGPRLVRLQEFQYAKNSTGTAVAVRLADAESEYFTLRRESLATGVQKAMGAKELEIGDDYFDAAFYLAGAPTPAIALLDFETRNLLCRLNGEVAIQIEGGELRAEIREGFGRHDLSVVLPGILRLSLEAARKLTDPMPYPERLAHIALRDLNPVVRLRALRCLTEEFISHPMVFDTLQIASGDRSPEIRLSAAVAWGPHGLPVLSQLAGDESVDDRWSSEAAAVAARQWPIARTTALLKRAREVRRPLTARACLEQLAATKDPIVIEPIAAVLATDTGELASEGALAAAAARGLGVLGGARAEAALLRALGTARAPVAEAVAASLGRIGSIDAVLPLKDKAESSSDAALRRAARQAIAEIQSRARGASPGQVSLAPAETGQLSLPAETAGQVSLPAAGPGAVSVARATNRERDA